MSSETDTGTGRRSRTRASKSRAGRSRGIGVATEYQRHREVSCTAPDEKNDVHTKGIAGHLLEENLIASLKQRQESSEHPIARVAPATEDEEKCSDTENTEGKDDDTESELLCGACAVDIDEVSLCAEDELECVVCMEEFRRENPMIRTLCECGVSKVSWHMMCLLEWLQREPTCPQCRGDVFFEEPDFLSDPAAS